MTKPLSYADSGVSIDAGDELVERIKPFAKKTLIPGVLGSIGGFGALFEISKDYKEPVLVTGTDGVGTKLKLAFLLLDHVARHGGKAVATNPDDRLRSTAQERHWEILELFSEHKLF